MAKFFRDSAFNQQSFGAAGFKVVSSTDASATTGDFVAIMVISSGITVGTGGIVTTTGDDLSDGTVIPKGMTIYGDFTSIDLSAGTALAYYRALG